MRKRSLAALLIALFSFLLIIPAFAQEDMVVVGGDSFKNQRRPPSVFRHDSHNETAEIEECNECHHVYENGQRVADESSEDQRCSDCHTEKNSGNQPGLRKAFHLNCKGCHQTKKQGPVMCGECHVKKRL
ncbi:MAG: cytochrome c3 family protein [Desulfobacterales bacterium]